MAFRGFNTTYPEYEVITPQTGKSFNVRSLTVAEEERLKGSFITPEKITEHLNKCIYEALVKKPEDITDYNSFLAKITVKDREALLYGLYHITYDEDRNYDVRCGACRKNYSVTIKASSTFNFTPYEGDDIISKRLNIKLPGTKGVEAILKQPTLLDEWRAVKELTSTPGFTVDNITETLIIEKFTQDVENSTEPITYSDRGDIIDAFLSLPSKDRRKIYKEWVDGFGQYGIELKMKAFCSNCGEEEMVTIDLVDQFFRSVYGS